MKLPAPLSLDRCFRASFYVTLVFACACLSYAEAPLLPESSVVVWPMGFLLLAAYQLEGRWSMSDFLANLVAVAIAAGIAAWTLYRLNYPPPDVTEDTSLAVRLLPHLGYLLIVLMLALLFRFKEVSNYWFLYGITFAAVSLACALDTDFIFGILLVGFLASGMWSLAVYYLWSGVRFFRTGPGPHAGAPAWLIERRLRRVDEQAAYYSNWRGWAVWSSVRRFLLITGLALVLFAATPRTGMDSADGGQLPIHFIPSGIGDSMVDLNRTGTVRLGRGVVFEAVARNVDGQRKLDLDPRQHWRICTLYNYEGGRWFSTLGPAEPSMWQFVRDTPGAFGPDDQFAHLGPERSYLTITYPSRRIERRLVLAEPVAVIRQPPRIAVRFLTKPKAGPLNPGSLPRDQECSYVQVVGPPSQLRPSALLPGDTFRDRFTAPIHVPGVRDWTRDLLQKLVVRGRLQPGDLEWDAEGNLLAHHHEQVARALEAYLSTSGEYTYTLELTREDTRTDPVYEFLSKVKRGHCERFASALAAMLRTLGVPGRIVLGYCGGDRQEDGSFVVRDSHAHSWVEVLVERAGPRGPEAYWLTLDPTPPADQQAAENFWAGWWRWAHHAGGTAWHNLIVDYNADRQEMAALELLRRLDFDGHSADEPATGWGKYLLGASVALALTGAWLWRRGRRRPAQVPLARSSTVSFHARLLAVLARRWSLRPHAAQTPQEFAALSAQRLRGEPANAHLADIPEQLTRLYYRVRYARLPLTAAECAEVNRCLELLA